MNIIEDCPHIGHGDRLAGGVVLKIDRVVGAGLLADHLAAVEGVVGGDAEDRLFRADNAREPEGTATNLRLAFLSTKNIFNITAHN